MNFAGFDLNSTSVRGVAGPDGVGPRPLVLQGTEPELPMAMSLQGRHGDVGAAGFALCREYPHLACLDFLPHLGTERTWKHRRHRLDAAKVLSQVFELLRPACAHVSAVALALAPYLSRPQVDLVWSLARKSKLPLVGSLPSLLAVAVAARQDHNPPGTVAVLDVDHFAFSWGLIRLGPDNATVLESHSLPHLNYRLWKECVLDAIANTCIHQSRRDPRDSGAAEQFLYDQLDDVFAVTGQEQKIEVVIRASSWCQNLILEPHQIRSFSIRLLRQTQDEIRDLAARTPDGNLGAILVTAAAARLPGLLAALQDETPEEVAIVDLAADAAARAAHVLAIHCQRGGLPSGHVDTSIPLTPTHANALPNKKVIPLSSADR